MSISLLFDGILILVLVFSAWKYSRKGFASGIVRFVGNLLSLFVAWLVSSKISPTVFENFFKTSMVNKTRDFLNTQGNINLEALVERFAGFLPAELKQSILQATSGILDTSTPDVALDIVEMVITPLLVPIISVVVFFVTLAVSRLVVGLVSAMLTGVNKIPLIGSVNQLLGVVVGVATGVIDVIVLLCIAWAAVIILGGDNPYWNETILQQSWFYQLFAPFNPFV